jgi:CDP-glucose 4,6-dehydratase
MPSTAGWSPDARFWRGRRVAVTGGTGFLGSHVVAQLVDLGAHVVVLRRDRPPVSPFVDAWTPRVSFVDGRAEDTSLLERMLGEYEAQVVLHLAAQSQVGVANRGPVSTFEANIQGTWSVLEAVRRSPSVSAVVVASSDKAYGDQPELPYREDMPLLPVHPYDVSKACADLITQCYAADFGVRAVITRCGNFFGPGDVNWERLIPGTARSLIRGERPVIRSDGTLTRDYLYVLDGVRAYLQLVEKLESDPGLAGGAFNFSTESPVSVLDLVSMLQDALGTSLEPDVQARASGEIVHQSLSAEKARSVLGWQPGYTMEKALAETGRWYRDWLNPV